MSSFSLQHLCFQCNRDAASQPVTCVPFRHNMRAVLSDVSNYHWALSLLLLLLSVWLMLWLPCIDVNMQVKKKSRHVLFVSMQRFQKNAHLLVIKLQVWSGMKFCRLDLSTNILKHHIHHFQESNKKKKKRPTKCKLAVCVWNGLLSIHAHL